MGSIRRVKRHVRNHRIVLKIIGAGVAVAQVVNGERVVAQVYATPAITPLTVSENWVMFASGDDHAVPPLLQVGPVAENDVAVACIGSADEVPIALNKQA